MRSQSVANILIVDDQPYTRKLIAHELTDVGHHVVDIGDLDSLWYHVGHNCPDLLLLNLALNVVESWEIQRNIKRKNKNLSIVTDSVKNQDDLNRFKASITSHWPPLDSVDTTQD